uniref:serine/threonine-protein kinase n=1 Tax=Pseudonocardia pini TaxID=2758030 RepID=UPI0015F0C22B
MAETFGPYRLDELVGRGGMGEVWRAFDTRRKRVVALKRLGAEHSGNAEFEARFRRECELAAQLNAPTVIPIHDYGEIDGALFLDMRFVEGEDLGARLREQGPLAPAAAVRIVEQLASALDAAHAAGLVHRDVKPSNTLLAAGDFVYLVDFGIVRSLASETVLTTANGVVGTAGYLAPERITGTGEDHRSDVYSLACLLHECLTGERPYSGATAAAVIAAHVHAPIPRPSARDPRLQPFDAVVAAGMAKDPVQRVPTAGAFARLAAEALRAPSVVAPAVI